MTPSCPVLPRTIASINFSSSGTMLPSATPRLSPKNSISWCPRYLGMRVNEVSLPSYTLTSSRSPRTKAPGSFCAIAANRRNSGNVSRCTPLAEW